MLHMRKLNQPRTWQTKTLLTLPLHDRAYRLYPRFGGAASPGSREGKAGAHHTADRDFSCKWDLRLCGRWEQFLACSACA